MFNIPNKKILCVDIGGSFVKAILLKPNGTPASAYQTIATPVPPSPQKIVATVQQLADQLEDFALMSVGFPGYVRNGTILTAPNLGTECWAGVNFQRILADHFSKPVRVVNDADLQGLGIASGKGLELVATLGTGFGTALLLEGKLLPHFEIAHHPVHGKLDYDQYVGEAALESLGVAAWNDRISCLIDILHRVFNYDRLYLSGGNARLVDILLPGNVRLSNNETGIRGGARLWNRREQPAPRPAPTPARVDCRRMMDINAMN
ncbi:ROK family protein [Neolewinella antarctica]|uniref:Polyphosphate glucokinase n=1 Tax=Neolewinella antarctica TaxID=442734 RepID=A0ABX0X8P7_9BACT|nr:ROK family protein [Neolewinella antarctica]NJC25602.1 polyphosphate glucokinase [Neolewinella antarctica]